jgi:hypothetical protein
LTAKQSRFSGPNFSTLPTGTWTQKNDLPLLLFRNCKAIRIRIVGENQMRRVPVGGLERQFKSAFAFLGVREHNSWKSWIRSNLLHIQLCSTTGDLTLALTCSETGIKGLMSNASNARAAKGVPIPCIAVYTNFCKL